MKNGFIDTQPEPEKTKHPACKAAETEINQCC
jgi:hypothetical protein